MTTCPECRSTTRRLPPPPTVEAIARYEANASSASTAGASDASEGAAQVVFLPLEKRTRRGAVDNFFSHLLFAVAALWSADLDINGHNPLIYTLAVLFSMQYLYLAIRTPRRTKQVALDPLEQERLSVPLKEICGIAGCAVPAVMVREGVIAAGVYQKNGRWILIISKGFVDFVDDDQLRSILAHEVAHIVNDDYAAALRSARLSLLPVLAVGLFFIFHENGSNNIPAAVAMLPPAIKLSQLLTGPFGRHREANADIEGVKLIGDADAMVGALEAVYVYTKSLRREFYGPPPLSWLLIPFSLRRTTHPSLQRRIANIRAMNAAASTTLRSDSTATGG